MAMRKNPKFDLKRKYKKVFELSLIVSLSILILAFKYFPKFQKQSIVQEDAQELVNVEDIIRTRQETQPPPPPKPPIPIEAPSDDVLDDIEISETELDQNATIDAPPPPPREEAKDDDPAIFVVVEELPEPVGGMQAVQDRIKYPPIAQRAGVQGTVFIEAFVDKNGDVFKTEIAKGIGAGCDEEAARVIKETKFKPGRQRGKPVNVRVMLRIKFTLIN